MTHKERRIIKVKRSYFRPALIIMLICCILCTAVLTGCSKEPEMSAANSPYDTVIDSTSALLPDGTGIRQEHITLAGFGMGTDTFESFSAKFGAPASSEEKEYSAEKIISAKYDYGVVEFDGPLEGPQVLTYAGITGELSGPCMVMPGDDLYLTADAIYTDSSKKIREFNSDTDTSVYLYGAPDAAASGEYTLLDSEFVTSDMPEVSCITYYVPFANGARVRYVIYFDSNNKVTRYDIYYETQQ